MSQTNNEQLMQTVFSELSSALEARATRLVLLVAAALLFTCAFAVASASAADIFEISPTGPSVFSYKLTNDGDQGREAWDLITFNVKGGKPEFVSGTANGVSCDPTGVGGAGGCTVEVPPGRTVEGTITFSGPITEGSEIEIYTLVGGTAAGHDLIFKLPTPVTPVQTPVMGYPLR
jgi:hypothetical protein